MLTLQASAQRNVQRSRPYRLPAVCGNTPDCEGSRSQRRREQNVGKRPRVSSSGRSEMRDLQALRVSSLGMAGRMRRLEATCTAANKHAGTRRRHNGTRPLCGPAASSPYRRDRAAFAFVCLCSGRPARVGTEYREPCALLRAGVEAPRIPISHSSGRVSATAGAARQSSRLTIGPCRSPPLIPHFPVGSIGNSGRVDDVAEPTRCGPSTDAPPDMPGHAS